MEMKGRWHNINIINDFEFRMTMMEWIKLQYGKYIIDESKTERSKDN